MASTWTNEAAIEQWNAATTRAAMEATADYGDVAKHHLVNPVLLRMLGTCVASGCWTLGAETGTSAGCSPVVELRLSGSSRRTA